MQVRFLELYEPIHEQFHRYCEVMAENKETARDLQSDVILAAYESFEKLRKPESFKYFLFGIARNIFRKNLKKNKVRQKYAADHAVDQQSRNSTAETDVDIRFLYEKLEMLPDKQKEALILFEISGFSLKEIQEIQGDSLSAVKLRLSRGRQKLRELMTDRVVRH